VKICGGETHEKLKKREKFETRESQKVFDRQTKKHRNNLRTVLPTSCAVIHGTSIMLNTPIFTISRKKGGGVLRYIIYPCILEALVINVMHLRRMLKGKYIYLRMRKIQA
jgi:hypothetical protein